MYFKQETTNTIIIEKSRFITYMKRVKNEEEYKEYLSQIRKKHYDASHVCSAFICGNIRRSSDDGEPSGTAGAPILSAMEKSNLNEMSALVVRYFGGIKLGTGGLNRAYSSSVSECIKKAILMEEYEYPLYELKLDYETANRIDYYLRNNSLIDDIIYDTEVTYIFALDNKDKLETIREYTKGLNPVAKGIKTIEKVVE